MPHTDTSISRIKQHHACYILINYLLITPILRPCLVPIFFGFDTVALSFVFDNYYSTID